MTETPWTPVNVFQNFISALIRDPSDPSVSDTQAPFATMLAAFVQGAEERLGKVQGQVEAARKAAESLVVFMAEPREVGEMLLGSESLRCAGVGWRRRG